MVSSGREATARPVGSPRGRWSEYTQLSRQIKQAGLLDRRRGWYLVRVGLNLVLLAAGTPPSPSSATPVGRQAHTAGAPLRPAAAAAE
jgi:hypothetical protein